MVVICWEIVVLLSFRSYLVILNAVLGVLVWWPSVGELSSWFSACVLLYSMPSLVLEPDGHLLGKSWIIFILDLALSYTDKLLVFRWVLIALLL